MSQPFGVYLQCYKNPFATYKCLESLRRHYPDCTVILLSDNGYDYTNMAKFFNCIYIHETQNLPLIYKDIDTGSHINHAIQLIKRICNAFQLCKEEYIMWLEDDVVINKPITDTFKHSINGFCPNNIEQFKNNIELKEKYPYIDSNNVYKFTGHGGSVFHKQTLLNTFTKEDIVIDILLNWKNYGFPTDICQDFLFSVLAILNGGTVGPYEGHCDGYGNNIRNNINVQHQYKRWYDIELPNELKHLVKI
jgi:hypothetical protein